MSILAGGYPAWKAAGQLVESSSVSKEDVMAATAACKDPPSETSYACAKDATMVGLALWDRTVLGEISGQRSGVK